MKILRPHEPRRPDFPRSRSTYCERCGCNLIPTARARFLRAFSLWGGSYDYSVLFGVPEQDLDDCDAMASHMRSLVLLGDPPDMDDIEASAKERWAREAEAYQRGLDRLALSDVEGVMDS